MILIEQIKRIKSMMGLILEVDEKFVEDKFSEIKNLSNIFDSDVEKLQQFLDSKGYDLGKFGVNKDGIDGKYGKVTRRAHKSYLNKLSPEKFNKKREETVQNKKEEKQSVDKKNIIIGDSQTPYVDMNTKKAERISKKPGKSSLWEGGKTVAWLISALEEYKVSPSVNNVIIVIGTNGGFGKFLKDDIPKLFSLLKSKFPNARFIVVQGSWGWGGLKKITRDDVKKYYKKFEDQGATIIEPPIGEVEPHGNRPVYSEIGAQIDSLL